MSVLLFKKRKAAAMEDQQQTSPQASPPSSSSFSHRFESEQSPPATEEKPSQTKCSLQTLADLCELLRKQEETSGLPSATIQESSAIADECFRKYVTASQDQQDPAEKISGDDESTEYEEIDLGGEGGFKARGGNSSSTSGEDEEEEEDEEEYYKLHAQYRSIDTHASTSTTASSLYPGTHYLKKPRVTTASSKDAQIGPNNPHYLYPEIPRILKRDVRRKYSFMFANVMNSYNSQLVDGFLRKFATEDIVYYSKVQMPAITGRDFDVLSLEGIEYVSAFLCSLQLLFPDFLLQVKETKLKQTLPSLETRVISRYRFSATYLYDMDVLTLGNLIKRGYTLSCSSANCPRGACPLVNSSESALNTQFHHCSLLKPIQSPRSGETKENQGNDQSHDLAEGGEIKVKEENDAEPRSSQSPLKKQRVNESPQRSPSTIKLEHEEKELRKGACTAEVLNQHMKLRSPPKYSDLEGVLYFQINEQKKIQKIVFVGKKKKVELPCLSIGINEAKSSSAPPTPLNRKKAQQQQETKKKVT